MATVWVLHGLNQYEAISEVAGVFTTEKAAEDFQRKHYRDFCLFSIDECGVYGPVKHAKPKARKAPPWTAHDATVYELGACPWCLGNRYGRCSEPAGREKISGRPVLFTKATVR